MLDILYSADSDLVVVGGDSQSVFLGAAVLAPAAVLELEIPGPHLTTEIQSQRGSPRHCFNKFAR